MADQLSPALDGKFRAKGTTPGVCYTRKRQQVDLRTIDLATAQQLVAEGFEFLEAIGSTEATAKPEAPAPAEAEPPAPAARPRRRSRKTPAA